MYFHAAIRARKGYKIMIQAVKKMKISDVRIRLVENGDGKLRAVASMTIDDCFVIHDIKIIDGPEGIFVAMPSKKNGRGEYKDIAHPINTETRNEIVTTILDAYKLEEAKATH